MLKDDTITGLRFRESSTDAWIVTSLACCLFVFGLTNHANAQYVFDDGGTHVIDHIDIQPGDMGTATVSNGTTVIANELEILRIPDEDDRGLSFSVTDGTLDVNGGFIGPTVLEDARLNLRGGVYAEFDLPSRSFITGRGNSELSIADGALTKEFTHGRLSFNAVTIEDQSELNMSGGSLVGKTAIWSHDESNATITGGSILGVDKSIILEGDSRLTVLGGAFEIGEDEIGYSDTSLFDTRGESSLFIFGGTHESSMFGGTRHKLVEATGKSTIQIANVDVKASFLGLSSDGWLFQLKEEATMLIESGTMSHGTYTHEGVTPSVLVEDDTRLQIDGGTFRVRIVDNIFPEPVEWTTRRVILDATESSQIDVRGGDFTVVSLGEFDRGEPVNDVYLAHAADQSTVSISGGMTRLNPELDEVVPLTVAARDEASIFISGSEFNYPLGDLADLDGMLTGTLADGNPFQWRFEREETARIVLVPEPATAWLLLLSGISLWRSTRKWRKRQ